MLFKDVIGNAEVKLHLANMVQQNRISHALLFLGKEGCGALPLAIAFGRLGCLFAGCCEGLLLSSKWTSWLVIPNPYNLPAPLFEAASALILFWLFDDSSGQRRTKKLTDGSLDLVVRLIQLSSLPFMAPLRKRVIALIGSID